MEKANPSQVQCRNEFDKPLLGSLWTVKLARLNASTWVAGAAAAHVGIVRNARPCAVAHVLIILIYFNHLVPIGPKIFLIQ
jgi:hypothetical protein